MAELPPLSPLPDLPPDAAIAQATELAHINVIGEQLGFDADDLEPYGRHKAKVSLDVLERRRAQRPQGKLVLVTAMTATRFGDGKTVTSISLAQGFGKLGVSHCLALREPSLGPTFGIKGGAAGGGRSQVLPMEDINMHFTGDLHAVTSANNLLAAVVDNHVHHQERAIKRGKAEAKPGDLDPARIAWRRVLDVCDRQLRHCEIGLGKKSDGFPHASGFDITAASEVMAVLALAKDRADLEARLERMVVGWTRDGRPVRAGELDCIGALEVLLYDALAPNLVQTIERTPALIHCGPFANIAHGCNSVVATELALHSADWVVTEAGFAADLGAEKFLDIKCRQLGTFPAAAVLVVTCRALKLHGGVALNQLGAQDIEALTQGFANVRTHLSNLRDVYGVPVVVAINRFGFDTNDELQALVDLIEAEGARWAISDGFGRGGEGATALAEAVMAAGAEGNRPLNPCYELGVPLRDKVETLARTIYRADGVDWSEEAEADLAQIVACGGDELPICVAKTQHSLSDNPELRGAPTGWRLRVAGLKLSAGAGFVVVRTGDLMLMPGMPKKSAAQSIGLDAAGNIVGLS
ncbi:formate--tetrahydrofolate ligase [Enhygromyxa salina]|uniref:Formate--tetrahydrofolate ligase n=1 Tax=Enhygromyxa salina TaxID=215803 RepID=A0A2S9Y2F4_9BACT|nr:formate--tetrahydrofolate ligase [Enhygromyxa salina]PRP99284.1 Formate--tetrahydrofolate ligase [Enhygromyxa salina]